MSYRHLELTETTLAQEFKLKVSLGWDRKQLNGTLESLAKKGAIKLTIKNDRGRKISLQDISTSERRLLSNMEKKLYDELRNYLPNVKSN